jgi:hypothetical protein
VRPRGGRCRGWSCDGDGREQSRRRAAGERSRVDGARRRPAGEGVRPCELAGVPRTAGRPGRAAGRRGRRCHSGERDLSPLPDARAVPGEVRADRGRCVVRGLVAAICRAARDGRRGVAPLRERERQRRRRREGLRPQAEHLRAPWTARPRAGRQRPGSGRRGRVRAGRDRALDADRVARPDRPPACRVP